MMGEGENQNAALLPACGSSGVFLAKTEGAVPLAQRAENQATGAAVAIYRAVAVFHNAIAPFCVAMLGSLWPLVLASLVLPFLHATAGAEGIGPAEASPAEQFKRFISSPPIIKNLVWQQKVPMDGGQRPLDGTFALSTRFDYFQAKWQTNGMLFRRLNRPEDVTNFTFAGTLVSVSDHQHALVEAGGRMTTWDDRDPSVAGKKVSVFYTREFMLEPLRRVLNLGIMYADVGSLRWEGNRFRAECQVDGERVVINGELLATPDGPPKGLKVRYAFPHETYDYVVRYAYAPAVKYPFLPTVTTSFWLPKDRPGTEVEVDEYRILDFQDANAPLDGEAFDIVPFAQLNHWAPRVYTNGGFYEQGTNGVLRLAYMLGPPSDLSASRPRISRAALYVGWAGLNIAIFALMLGAKETNKQKNNDERSIAV